MFVWFLNSNSVKLFLFRSWRKIGPLRIRLSTIEGQKAFGYCCRWRSRIGCKRCQTTSAGSCQRCFKQCQITRKKLSYSFRTSVNILKKEFQNTATKEPSRRGITTKVNWKPMKTEKDRWSQSTQTLSLWAPWNILTQLTWFEQFLQTPMTESFALIWPQVPFMDPWPVSLTLQLVISTAPQPWSQFQHWANQTEYRNQTEHGKDYWPKLANLHSSTNKLHSEINKSINEFIINLFL